MREYISGYYCRNEMDLQILNKDTNRDILNALLTAHPSDLSIPDVAQKTRLPIKTVYSQMRELYQQYFTAEIRNKNQPKPRGRPPVKLNKARRPQRERNEVFLENSTSIFDPFDGKGNGETPLPPGHVEYSKDFIELWERIEKKHGEEVDKEVESLCISVLGFLEKMLRTIVGFRAYAPKIGPSFCCYQCGVNHEARDLLRAILIHVIDTVETSKRYVDFLKNNEFVTDEAHHHALTKIFQSNISKSSYRTLQENDKLRQQIDRMQKELGLT